MPDKDEELRSTLAEVASLEAKIAEIKALMEDDPVIALRKASLARQVQEYEEGVKNLKRDLKLLTGEAAAPAKRAETRPVIEPEKRGPGRPRKTE